MKHSGVQLSALSPKYQAMAAAELRGKQCQKNAIVTEPTRLRQSGKGPNKTELAFTAKLKDYFPGAVVHQHDITLLLANGLRYTPDNFVPLAEGAVLHMKPAFYEVKGFMRDDAAAKIKMAARVHAWANFYLATKSKTAAGGWQIERVLP